MMKTSDINRVQNSVTMLAMVLGEELVCSGVGLSDEGIGTGQWEVQAFVEGVRDPLLDRLAMCDDLSTRVRIRVAADMLREAYEYNRDAPPETALRVCAPLLRAARDFIGALRNDRALRV